MEYSVWRATYADRPVVSKLLIGSYEKGGTRHIPLGVLPSWANRLEAESSEDPVQHLPIRLSSCSRDCTGAVWIERLNCSITAPLQMTCPIRTNAVLQVTRAPSIGNRKTPGRQCTGFTANTPRARAKC